MRRGFGEASMVNRLIDVALKNRFIVVVVYLGLAGWGWWAVNSTPIDAIPDLSDNQVIVFTDWPGHSPQEVEDQITYPMTVSLQGLAGVRVLDDLRGLRGQRRLVLRTGTRARADESGGEGSARRRGPDPWA